MFIVIQKTNSLPVLLVLVVLAVEVKLEKGIWWHVVGQHPIWLQHALKSSENIGNLQHRRANSSVQAEFTGSMGRRVESFIEISNKSRA